MKNIQTKCSINTEAQDAIVNITIAYTVINDKEALNGYSEFKVINDRIENAIVSSIREDILKEDRFYFGGYKIYKGIDSYSNFIITFDDMPDDYIYFQYINEVCIENSDPNLVMKILFDKK